MDTLGQAVATDKLGRRNGPRRKYTIAEKRQIAQETLEPGMSVAVVAQSHGINANLRGVPGLSVHEERRGRSRVEDVQ
jgi:transposase-like protein